jgi:hypothetical protein
MATSSGSIGTNTLSTGWKEPSRWPSKLAIPNWFSGVSYAWKHSQLTPDDLPTGASPGFKPMLSPGCFCTPPDGQRTTSFCVVKAIFANVQVKIAERIALTEERK